MDSVKITLVGGPTALIEVDGYRFVTDPTFDMPGQYRLPHVTLTKTEKPAVAEHVHQPATKPVALH